MRRIRILVICAVLVSLVPGVARPEFVETWSTPGDLSGWQAPGEPTTNPGSGGNPGGYLRAEHEAGFAWASHYTSLTVNTPEFAGDIFAQHGDNIILNVDLAILSPGDLVGGFFHRFVSDAGGGGGDWRAKIPAPGGSQDMNDGWVNYQIPLNKNWTDEQATAAGWSGAQAAASFADHFAQITLRTNDIGVFDDSDGGDTGAVVGYDNYGFISPAPATEFTWDEGRPGRLDFGFELVTWARTAQCCRPHRHPRRRHQRQQYHRGGYASDRESH